MADLSIRPLHPNDVEHIVRYFHESSPADHERMGVDISNLPPVEELQATLTKSASIPPGQGPSCCMIWEMDGQPVGHAVLKDMGPDKVGSMHLHLWDSSLRGKGLGGTLFCLAAQEFYRLYDLQMIICEPRSTNPMPNRMLQKVGFPLVKTYVGKSGNLSAETELNRYEVRREVAERYLLLS